MPSCAARTRREHNSHPRAPTCADETARRERQSDPLPALTPPGADQIIAWHRCRATNGPAEAVNNLVKRVKRVAFGFRSFRNYRIRALLYTGRPNWNLLDEVYPR